MKEQSGIWSFEALVADAHLPHIEEVAHQIEQLGGTVSGCLKLTGMIVGEAPATLSREELTKIAGVKHVQVPLEFRAGR